MANIYYYYTVDVCQSFYRIWFIDLVKLEVKQDEFQHISKAAACQKFEQEHPRSVYVDVKAWDARLAQFEKDKARLALWIG